MTELFRTVLEMSITGAIIIAAVMLIRLCMKKLPRRYAYFLWIIPAIRLLCPVSVASEVSLFNLFPNQSVQVEYTEQVVTEQTAEPTETVIPQETTPVVTVHYPEQPAQPSQNIVNEKQPTEEAVPRNVSAISVVSAVWLAGAAAMLMYVASSYIRTYQRIRNAALLQNNIFISNSIDTPFVFGLIKPRIYIPNGISGADLQYILAHENAHIKRFDHVAKMLAMVILSVHWFNPLVWLGFKLMTDDMELSCDEKALGSYDIESRKAYANTLLNMSVRQNKLNLGGMLSFGESGIKTRIKGVLAMKKPKAVACVLAVAVIVVAAVCLLTSAKKLVVEDSERAIVTVTGTYAKYPENTSEIGSREIAKLLNSFNVKKIDRDDIYIPDEITAYSVTIYHKNNMDYDQISFYSPAYESDNTDNDIFRFIAVNTVTIRDNQPNIELLDFYQLTDSDYDKLCEAIVPQFEIFPEGYYESTLNEPGSEYEVYVAKENGTPNFEIRINGNTVKKFSPSKIYAAGLVASEGDRETGMTIRYLGNGIIKIEPALTSSAFMGDFVWKGKAEDITEDDTVLQANTRNEMLGSFVIEKTTIGYEAHSPLTDIYIKFTEDDHSQLFLCKENASGGTDEYIYDFRGGFSPNRTAIYLHDITGDGTDDLLLDTHVTGTGAVDSIFIAVDGSSMKEIPVYRIGAEKMIAEMSEELLKDEKFEGKMPMIIGYMPEMDYEYIYPYYPDTSVRRYGGMSYNFTDGKLTGVAAIGFVRNDEEHSKYHYVEFEFEYQNGSLVPVSMKLDDEEQEEHPDLTLCTDYLNSYWNDLFKTGTFTPENYISDSDMLALANARKQQNADSIGNGIVNAEIKIYNSTVQSGTTSDGKTWVCFIYDVQLNMEDSTSSTEGYKGYTAYFELDSDNKIYREYQLWGAEKEALGLDDEFTLPFENADINAAINEITERLEPEIIKTKPYTITSKVYKVTEHGYSLDKDNSTQLEISFELPENWDLSGSTADLDGGKIFEIGVPYPESQGINYDSFKIDEVLGREITVHDEKIGTDSDPFEYYINKSVPDFYSDDGMYDSYDFIVNSGGYNLYMSFIADAGVEYEVFEQVLRSVTIKELPSVVEADTDYVPALEDVFYTTENTSDTSYDIQFEKLAGTEDAEEFNLHQDELLTYFNSIIDGKNNLTLLSKSNLDFNNENYVQGVKRHGEYTNYEPNAEYDDVMEQLNKTDYYWSVSIKTNKTAVYALIRHCNDDNCKGFHFGDDWCIRQCIVSRATGKVGSSKVSAVGVYALYDSAEDNLNRLIKANKDDEIKVVYANIGQLGTEYHDYIDGGIVFVNGVAKYIYASGFNLHYDKVNEQIPDEVFNQMEKTWIKCI